jgi:hypothetical protein
VVASAQCGGANAHDTVEVTVDGSKKQAPLDGCGQAKGTVLDVVLTNENGQLSAHAADAAQVGGGRDGRLTALLLCLSAAAGALYAYLIRYRPVPKVATPAPVIGADEPPAFPAPPIHDEAEPVGEPEPVEANEEPEDPAGLAEATANQRANGEAG